ncbi:hypothetical protein Pedsa_2483 [Pseudopedobacter saltans DSM 12145]|uniref:Inner membrane protein YgaP-like transmembrane domain-containing protein n=1 Tax=Pseudopedobacter saltans (strain ATCC 51119 / DSM 12145 / JCM 21818 / CCUG 39354 / LMG 10337 / NBRC 100064 / NCIMB 13643) TaxID=762903 RepID=F0SEW2_PSESL|nr:YgaP-like transmembrane domain [Pseudopedobacter saltans]ADY53028.1 hypothetical protein Pedsa_2483 [Pseudopedobacter saltans DSM 12145]
MKNLIRSTKELLEELGMKESHYTNLGKTERVLSIATGSYFALKGITNIFSHPFIAATSLMLACGLIGRGTSGYCPIKEQLEKDDIVPEPVLIVREEITELGE